MITPHREPKTRSGFVLVNIRTSRPLYFTGVFNGCGRNMSCFLEDAYVFETRAEASQYIELNALVDDLDVQSFEVQRTGFGRRARAFARAILKNQVLQDIASLAAISIFMVSAGVWLAILSSMRGM
jgi:hypothetical protein